MLPFSWLLEGSCQTTSLGWAMGAAGGWDAHLYSACIPIVSFIRVSCLSPHSNSVTIMEESEERMKFREWGGVLRDATFWTLYWQLHTGLCLFPQNLHKIKPDKIGMGGAHKTSHLPEIRRGMNWCGANRVGERKRKSEYKRNTLYTCVKHTKSK